MRAKIYKQYFFFGLLSFKSVFIQFVYDVFHVNGKARRFRDFEKVEKKKIKQ